jgi:redox-sensing transcriptional repressor
MNMPNRTCIMRLSRYRNAILRLKALNFIRCFSDNLADAASVTSAQVRKDFSIFGITGHRRGGYQVDNLLNQLNEILGKDKTQDIILVGVGNIGKALLHYPGFEKSGMRIVAGFDIDPTKYAQDLNIPILPLEKMRDYILTNHINIGIIAVPDYAAQQVLELMKSAGIKGVLNFAPITLRESADFVINNINLVTELENIIYFVKAADSAMAM